MRNMMAPIMSYCTTGYKHLCKFYAQSFRNRIIIVAGIGAGILCLIIIDNAFIDASLKKNAQQAPARKTPTCSVQPTALPGHVTIHHELVPENPEKYGIIVQSTVDQPRNQPQWDIFMDKVLVKSGLLEQEKAKPALKMMKKTPDEFRTRMKEIDDRIALFEQKKIENPSDEDAPKRLQTLFMLRAMMQAMENKVTAP